MKTTVEAQVHHYDSGLVIVKVAGVVLSECYDEKLRDKIIEKCRKEG